MDMAQITRYNIAEDMAYFKILAQQSHGETEISPESEYVATQSIFKSCASWGSCEICLCLLAPYLKHVTLRQVAAILIPNISGGANDMSYNGQTELL